MSVLTNELRFYCLYIFYTTFDNLLRQNNEKANALQSLDESLISFHCKYMNYFIKKQVNLKLFYFNVYL